MKLICALFLALALSADAADFDLAAKATNQLGVDLYHQLAAGDTNLCLSPYSIETALAMTFAGAEGDTRTQMARVLHFPTDADAPHASFAALQSSLGEMSKKTAQIAEQSKNRSGPSEPITLSIANRLFAQSGYDFRQPFVDLVKKFYGAPFETLDFRKDPEAARAYINKWVADQTREKSTT
jgi:serpin B